MPSVSIAEPPALGGASGMLQLPHFFWNHLSTATAATVPTGSDLNSQEWSWNDLLNFDDTPVEQGQGLDLWMDTQAQAVPPAIGPTVSEAPTANHWAITNAAGESPFPFPHGSTPGNLRSDQAAISAALMSFMADMTKQT